MAQCDPVFYSQLFFKTTLFQVSHTFRFTYKFAHYSSEVTGSTMTNDPFSSSTAISDEFVIGSEDSDVSSFESCSV